MVSARGIWYGPFRVADVSLGGVRLVGASAPPDEAWVQVALRFSARATLMCAARVVRRDDTGLALVFDDLAPEDEQTINSALGRAGTAVSAVR